MNQLKTGMKNKQDQFKRFIRTTKLNENNEFDNLLINTIQKMNEKGVDKIDTLFKTFYFTIERTKETRKKCKFFVSNQYYGFGTTYSFNKDSYEFLNNHKENNVSKNEPTSTVIENEVHEFIKEKFSVFLRGLTRYYNKEGLDKTYLKKYFEIEDVLLMVSKSDTHPNSINIGYNVNYFDKGESLRYTGKLISSITWITGETLPSIPMVDDRSYTLELGENINSYIKWFENNNCCVDKSYPEYYYFCFDVVESKWEKYLNR